MCSWRSLSRQRGFGGSEPDSEIEQPPSDPRDLEKATKRIFKSAGLYMSDDGLVYLSQRSPTCQLAFLVRDPVARCLSALEMERIWSGFDPDPQELCTVARTEALAEFNKHHDDRLASITGIDISDWTSTALAE